MDKERLSANIKALATKLKDAKLVAVSKYSDIEDVAQAFDLGLKDFGENRVQDLMAKAQYFKENNLVDVKWHFIGNLQSNKVKELLQVPNLYAIHSVSSLSLLKEIYKRIDLYDESAELKIFLQINTSLEDEKSGLETSTEINEALEFIKKENNPKIKLYGLMTMGSIRSEDFVKSAHECFQKLYDLKVQIQSDWGYKNLELSMGMSQDFEIAIEHHASYIRIGSAIFK